MRREARAAQPVIIRRYFRAAALAALIPSLVVAAAALLVWGRGTNFEQQVTAPVRSATQQQFQLALQADAARVDERLCRTSALALALAANTAAVLKAPAAYTPHAPAAEPKPGVPPPKAIENPAYYPRGADGALRKPVDDGLSAVFYMAREGKREFTEFEHQQLYATSVMDPLLIHSTKTDALCACAYIATKDGLLRMYPWANLQSWPGGRNVMAELTMCSYGKDKANAQGVVWTKPYASKLSGKWAIACVAPIISKGAVVGVAGCEINLDSLPQALFTQSKDWLEWFEHPEGMVVAAPVDGRERLGGATPLSALALAKTGMTEKKAFDAASILKSSKGELADAWTKLGSSDGLMSISNGSDVSLVGRAKLPTLGWSLCAISEQPGLAALAQYSEQSRKVQIPVYLLLAVIIGLSTVIAGVLAGLEGRRIAAPLTIMAAQVRSVIDTGVVAAVATHDEGELGELSRAVQELVDIACIRAAENGTVQQNGQNEAAVVAPVEEQPATSGRAQEDENASADSAPVVTADVEKTEPSPIREAEPLHSSHGVVGQTPLFANGDDDKKPEEIGGDEEQ